MRLKTMVSCNLKFYFKKTAVLIMIITACLLAVLMAVGLLIEHFEINGGFQAAAVFQNVMLWTILFIAKEAYDVNYKISTANCISRKTVMAAALISFIIFMAFLSALTVACEYLLHLFYRHLEYSEYSLVLFADALNMNISPIAAFLIQMLIYGTVACAVILICTLTSRLPNYGIAIMYSVFALMFLLIIQYFSRIYFFFYNNFGINLLSGNSITVMLSALFIISAAVHFLIFRRLSFVKAASR